MSIIADGQFAGFGDAVSQPNGPVLPPTGPQLPTQPNSGGSSNESAFQARLREAGVPTTAVAGVALALGSDDPSAVDMNDFGYIELAELRTLLLTVEVGGNKLTPLVRGAIVKAHQAHNDQRAQATMRAGGEPTAASSIAKEEAADVPRGTKMKFSE